MIAPGDEVPADVSGLVLMGGSDVNPALYDELAFENRGSRRCSRPIGMRAHSGCSQPRSSGACYLPGYADSERPARRYAGAASRNDGTSSPQNAGQGLTGASSGNCRRARSRRNRRRATRWDVNSRHHQAIRSAGRVCLFRRAIPKTARSSGGSGRNKRFVVGVQWHPENSDRARGSPGQEAVRRRLHRHYTG